MLRDEMSAESHGDLDIQGLQAGEGGHSGSNWVLPVYERPRSAGTVREQKAEWDWLVKDVLIREMPARRWGTDGYTRTERI